MYLSCMVEHSHCGLNSLHQHIHNKDRAHRIAFDVHSHAESLRSNFSRKFVELVEL